MVSIQERSPKRVNLKRREFIQFITGDDRKCASLFWPATSRGYCNLPHRGPSVERGESEG
jgi:hypothetical protein